MFAEATTRFALHLGALALIVALTGCTSFNKRNDNDRSKDGGGNGPPPPRFPAGGAAAPANTGTANPNVTPTNAIAANQGAILAGRVIDNYSRPPGNTTIRWVNLDENKEIENDISVTPEGYFTIQGLKPNGRYKLVARGKQGERLVAGTQYATAPNIRVLIQVDEKFANGGTPPVPGPPVPGMQNDQNKTSSLDTNSKAHNPTGWAPVPFATISGPGQEPALPVAINVANPRSSSNNPPANNWTPGNGQNWPPTLEIKGGKATLPPLSIPNVPLPPAPTSGPGFSPALANALKQVLIPSCVRVGDRIENFALNDVNGQPWELRQRKGKLVLVDFWATYCKPCLESMPHLRDLQSRYGRLGLEVIGIANEPDGPLDKQAYDVMATCKRLGINYRQLLSVGPDCPVRKEFHVNYLPSMYLLDEQGNIIWRADRGMPTADERATLERIIQRRLVPSAF